MQTGGRIKKVLIVGGGTAGWMAAIYMNRYLRRTGCTLTLVESADIGTIGVGEATVPSIVQFVRLLGLDEREFMRRCSATYKLGIRFDDWKQGADTYFHPFGAAGTPVNGLDLFHYWLKRKLDKRETRSYTDYCLQARLAEGLKAPAASTLENGSYAYHLDAGALAQYLKELATAEGVRHVFGDVGAVVRADNGNIESADIGGDRRIEADLFVDATGFRGRLIEQELGDPWIDWSHFMLCDSALALPLPRTDEMNPFTRSTAVEAGWMWRIPLNNRTGSGIVYSSAHMSEERAAQRLIEHSGVVKTRSLEPRKLKIRVGRRTRFWHYNCVSIGLSSGFVEPLESTGIHLIQHAIMSLMDYWPDSAIDASLRNAFNARMTDAYDEVRDFIMLHYLLSRRSEPFWEDARDVRVPDALEAMLGIYDECGRIEHPRLQTFREFNYFFILAGNDRLPRRPVSHVDVINGTAVGELMRPMMERNESVLAGTGSHAALLAAIHRQAF